MPTALIFTSLHLYTKGLAIKNDYFPEQHEAVALAIVAAVFSVQFNVVTVMNSICSAGKYVVHRPTY